MKIKLIVIGILLTLGGHAFAQEPADAKETFWNRIFLPSIDVGQQIPSSDLLRSSTRIGTSIEYRIRNKNHFFIRLNYDTYSARYIIDNLNNTTNTIEGTVQFTDIVSGFGYRMGNNTFRLMFTIMPGVKLYEFPTATLNGQQIIVRQMGKSIFTTIALTTLEYYIDKKSALTFSIYQNQVWQEVDFWVDSGSAVGFSVGFITSLL